MYTLQNMGCSFVKRNRAQRVTFNIYSLCIFNKYLFIKDFFKYKYILCKNTIVFTKNICSSHTKLVFTSNYRVLYFKHKHARSRYFNNDNVYYFESYSIWYDYSKNLKEYNRKCNQTFAMKPS